MTDAEATSRLLAMGCHPDVVARAEIGAAANMPRGEVLESPLKEAKRCESPDIYAARHMVLSWTIRIPGWHPPSDNAIVGEHWGAKVRVKKAAAEILGLYVGGIPLAIGKRRVWTHLVMAPKQRCPDPTNLFKVLLDSLKKAGVLRDDSDKWCAAERPTFSRGAERVTFITLEDCT